MRHGTALAVFLWILMWISPAGAGEVEFRAGPDAKRLGDEVTIRFTLSAQTDVEAAILDGRGQVIRHLAAGLLGQNPPAPLRKGLSQEIRWDGRDDFGRRATAGPFRCRVRAGTGFEFGRFIGADPYNLGSIDSLATDRQGNFYVLGFGGEANQGHMVLRVFDGEGRYLREILPFPADLPPEAVTDIARWDPDRKAFHPRQLKNLNPDFYDGNRHGCLHLVAVSSRGGVLLTDGDRLCKIDLQGAVPESRFAFQTLWPPGGKLPNTGSGPTHLRISQDGKYLYLSGPYSSRTAYGHTADRRFPPGQVYRMEVGKGTMAPFVRLPTIGENPAKPGLGWCSKHISHPEHYTVPHGPIHDIATDGEGYVYVADQDNQRVALFDPSGVEAGSIAVPYPDVLALHPHTGALYVLTREIKGYHRFQKKLVKFSGRKDPRRLAEMDLGVDGGAMPGMALSAGRNVLWISGLQGGLVAVEDRGEVLEKKEISFAPRLDVPADWNRLAVDHDRDELYISNGTTRIWRYSGKTGEGGILRKGGRDFLANDLAVGYHGNLYVRVSGRWDGSAADYSGPFWRLDRALDPVPFSAIGTHVLSPYIYSRYGIGFAERGIGVGPRGESYVSFMYRWVAYAVAGFGPGGKPLPGRYLEGQFPGKGKYPRRLTGAIIGPIPQANAGIRVDLAGNIYVGLLYWPRETPLPTGFRMDRVWTDTVGSVVKFDPGEGGAMPGDDGAQRAAAIQGALGVYPGLAPFSKAGLGGNTCCVCRGPRFDLDRYGRLGLPNAVTSSVLLYDNAGNLLARIGRYGNFDSRYVNPNTARGKRGEPTVAVPGIPLAWPTGVGLSEDHVYVNDTYARRAVRLDRTHAAEETCGIP